MIQFESIYTQLGRYEDIKPPKATQTVLLSSPVGDVHLWGILLPKIILENNGVRVIWAPQCSPERLLCLVKKNHNLKAIVITALLTTSRPSILDMILALNQAQVTTTLIIGGIAISKKWIESELSDPYKGNLYMVNNSKDILNCVNAHEARCS